jgi:3-hydroxyacyl-[acyl-carrier-protein] dehydratase
MGARAGGGDAAGQAPQNVTDMTDAATPEISLDVEQIKKLLPHRPPFLFLERLTDIRPHESAVGYKAVSVNEPHFLGHFPDFAVMPGVLIVEAMAQAAGALVVHSLGLAGENPQVYFMTIDKARFRRPVRPGDLLRIPVKALRRRGPVWRFAGEAYVGDVLCAEAEFSAMIREGARGDDADPSDGNR